MPFRPDPFLRKFRHLRRLRQNPSAGYVVAVASVAAASLVRESFSDALRGIPFGPFYLAVAVAAAAGGGAPGVLALGLSIVAANYLAPPAFAVSFTIADIAASVLFAVAAGVLLTLIWLLNRAIDHLWTQAENSTLILESQPAGVIGVDAEGRINLVNSVVEQQLGYRREELFEQSIELLVPSDVRAQHTELRTTFMERPVTRMMGAGRDLYAVTKDGSLLPVEVGLNPVISGGKSGALATIIDISERKDLERRAQMLADEVSHRARNLLTVVQALALRQLPKESSAEFVRTLDALARTQKILGTATVAPLRAILKGELRDLGKELVVSGCRVLLTPAAAQDFSLIIHELATNSLKYGALSVAGGKIKIRGIEADGKFRFVWSEEGGQLKPAPPSRTGYGRDLLQEIAKGLRAEMKVEYPPEGLQFELIVALDRITNVTELAGTSNGA